MTNNNYKLISRFLYCLIILTCTWTTHVNAQNVSTYDFMQVAGSYTSIGSGTSALGGGIDDASGAAQTFGFSFNYHGTAFTQFTAQSNGYIVLGATISQNYTPLSGVANCISFGGGDGRSGPSGIYWAVSGVAPNRVLTIEEPAYSIYYGVSTETVDVQIKLYETANIIQIIYGNSTHTSGYSRQVGLTGALTSDFAVRTTASDWSATTTGGTNTATMTWSASVFPAAGQTYIFSPHLAYCASGITTQDEIITNVTFGSINNSTGFSAGGYGDFSATTNTNLLSGSSYPISVNVSPYYGSSDVVFTWIDYNHSGTFDATELTTLASAALNTGTVAVPATALSGITRMRVRLSYANAANPCGTQTYGETEDYTVSISAPTGCSGTPTPGNTNSTAANACAGTPFTLSLQNATSGSGVTYQWKSSPDNITYTNFGTNAATQSVTQSSATYYKCDVSCSAGGTGTSNAVLVGQNLPLNCYCTPPQSSNYLCCAMYMSNVNTTGGTSNFSNSSAEGTASYQNYSATQIASQLQGNAVTINVTTNGYGMDMNVYIDYNDNGLFTDAGELVTQLGNTSPGLVSATFTVPVTAAAGTHRMRVRADYYGSGYPTGPCNQLSYGETEDYGFTVIVPAACSGSPNPDNTVSSINPICPGVNFTLSLQTPQTSTGITFQWQSADDAGFTTNLTNLGTASTQVTSQTTAKYYRCNVTCTNSGLSTFSNGLLVSMNAIDNCYCSPTMYPSNPCDYLSSVSTTGGVTNFTNTTGAYNGTGFTYFPASIVSQASGASFTLTLTAGGTCNISYYFVWIDYNQSGSFDPSEMVVNNGATNTGNTPTSFTINIPFAALNGNTRMRVMSRGIGSPIPTTACDNESAYYGETEDYVLNVFTAAGCTGTPASSSTVTAVNPICSGVNFTLGLSTTYSASGLTFLWETSPDGITWTSTGGTGVTYTTSQTVATYYHCIITCSNGGSSTTSTPLLVGVNSDFCSCGAYCASMPSFTADEEIYNVTVNGASTSAAYSNANACSATAPGPGSILNRYSNFRTLGSLTSIQQAQTVSFSIDENECDGATYYACGIAIWIDYNHDGTFNDATEKVFVESTTTAGPRTASGTFVVPVSALTGTTAMRVTAAEGYSGTGLTSCLSYGYGETEDYCIAITAAPLCSGTPAPGNTISGALAACPTQSFTLSLQNNPAESGYTYDWQSSPDGITYTSTGGTGTTYTTTQAVETWYQCVVTCSNGGASATSTAVDVTETVCYCTTPVYSLNLSGYGCSLAAGDYIGNFTFAGINNNSGCTANAAPFYTYFGALTANVAQTVSYPVSISAPATGAYFQRFKVYIDFNDNGSLDDAGEMVYDSGPISTSTNISTGSITISPTAPVGTHRLRVRSHNGLNTNNDANSCSDDGNIGEVEDYNITIDPAPVCSGTPTPGQTIASTPLACSSTAINLSLQNGTGGTGVTYQWQSASDIAFTSPTNLGTNPTETASESATTYYRCQVTCSGNTGNSTPVLVTYSVPCYCTSQTVGSDGCGVQIYLNNVTFAGINNTSGCWSNVPYTAPYYSYFPATPAAVNAGSTYPISISTPTNPSSYYHWIGVWMDWNNNGSFEDAGELVLATPDGSSTVTNSLTGNIAIPITTATGTYKMRVRSGNVSGAGVINSCSMSSVSGEMEDYDVNVTGAPACSGAPAPGNTLSTSVLVCPNEPYTVSLQNNPSESGFTYYWEWSDDGMVTWEPIPGSTATASTTISQTSFWVIHCLVTCTASGLTTASNTITVNMKPAYQCGCDAGATTIGCNTGDEYVGNVTFNTINNNSACPSGATPQYSDFTSISTSVLLGQSYEASVLIPNWFSGDQASAWIDFDQNGSLLDAGEQFDLLTGGGNGSTPLTGTITIPSTAIPGPTLLRIRGNYTGAMSPCGINTYGEVEDYLVNIVAPNATYNGPLCEDDTLKLFPPTAGSSYSWTTTSSNGFTSSLQNPTIPHAVPADAGVYTVVVTTGSGSYSADVTVIINPSPSVSASGDPAFCEGSQDLHLFTTAPTAVNYAWSGPGGYTSGAANPVRTSTTAAMSGNYTVVVTDANGCSASDINTVLIYALPPVNITVIGSNNLCTGQTTSDLQATGAGTYSWSTTETTDLITVATGGTYVVTGTDIHNCVNTYNVVITESPAPAAPIVTPAGPITLCSSDGGATYTSATLTVQNYSSDLLWSTSETTTSITVDYGDIFNVTYTDAAGCYSVSNPVVTNAYLASADPTGATSNALNNNICLGNNVALTVAGGSLGDNADWHWYEGTGACGTGTARGTGSSISVTPSTAGLHHYTVRAEGSCGPTTCASIDIMVSTAPPSGTSHYTAAVTSGCNGAVGLFSTNAVAGATYYSWSGTSGALYAANIGGPFVAGPFQTTTPTVYVQFASPAPAGGSGYSICCFAGNACGQSNTICTWVRSKISQPGAISGAIMACTGGSGTYSIAPVVGADTYTWTITGSANINGGGTTLTTASSSITLNFLGGWTSGSLSVYASMNCGFNSAPRTVALSNTPAVPGTMSGPGYVCPSNTATFSVAAVPGAASYNWTCSVAGAILTPSANSCSISFPAVIPGGSTVCVAAVSPCGGASATRCKGIANGTPNTPGAISGPSTGLCGQSGVSYSITPVAQATGYLWTVNNGAVVSGPNNLSGVSINFPAAFTTCTLSVVALNSCGSSLAHTLVITSVPAQPGVISGNQSVCVGAVESYSTAGSSGATSYTWSSPAGSTVLNPGGASVLIQWGATGGIVSVIASNACGNSIPRNLSVAVTCRQSQVSETMGATATLYPNPTSGKTTVKFESSNSAKYVISVVDVTGRTIISDVVTAAEGINMHELDLSKVAKGIYLVRMESAGAQTQLLKVTVE